MKNNRVEIYSVNYNETGKFKTFIIGNGNLLPNYEVLAHIFNRLMTSEEFRSFGFYKIIIITADIDNRQTAFHPNVYIDNNTTYEAYYNKVKTYINDTYGEYGYGVDKIGKFIVRVWNMDDGRNERIKITLSTKSNKNKIRSYSTSAINLQTSGNQISEIKKILINTFYLLVVKLKIN